MITNNLINKKCAIITQFHYTSLYIHFVCAVCACGLHLFCSAKIRKLIVQFIQVIGSNVGNVAYSNEVQFLLQHLDVRARMCSNKHGYILHHMNSLICCWCNDEEIDYGNYAIMRKWNNFLWDQYNVLRFWLILMMWWIVFLSTHWAP